MSDYYDGNAAQCRNLIAKIDASLGLPEIFDDGGPLRHPDQVSGDEGNPGVVTRGAIRTPKERQNHVFGEDDPNIDILGGTITYAIPQIHRGPGQSARCLVPITDVHVNGQPKRVADVLAATNAADRARIKTEEVLRGEGAFDDETV